MVKLEELQEVFGEECHDYFNYLKNKNTGGLNNNRGNTFENHFAIFKIARSFNQRYPEDKLYFSSQVFSFIDDFVVEQNEEDAKNGWFYQIKDVQSLDWHGGTHPIGKDFVNQRLISEKKGISPFLRLVVSRDQVFDKLLSTRPENLQDVRLINFKSATTIPGLIRENDLVRSELVKMCAFENPSNYVLETLAAILLGSWDSTNKKQISLADILEGCYRQNPHYIKGFENRISRQLEEVFGEIEGFRYSIEGGYIRWRFKNTDEGVVMFRIGSKEFIQWEMEVLNTSISTFENLEPLLS